MPIKVAADSEALAAKGALEWPFSGMDTLVGSCIALVVCIVRADSTEVQLDPS